MPPRAHVHGRLWWRQIIFLAASVVLAGLIAYDIIWGGVTWYWPVSAYLVGIGVGYLFGRAMKVRWHETNERVMMQNDAMTVVIIAAYLALRVGSDFLLADYFSGAALSAITFGFLGGILLGRYLGIVRSIYRVLREQNKLT